MNTQNKEALIAEIERFKAEALKMHIVQVLAGSYIKTGLFDYNLDSDGSVIWYKAQARQLWEFWQAQAVPEWISIQDRMPEQGQKVLVFRPDAHNHPHKDPNFKICTYAGADIFINSHFEHVITHWKPLESPIEAQEPAND